MKAFFKFRKNTNIKIRIVGIAAFFIVLLFALCGCRGSEEKERDEIEFSVCYENTMPKELREIVNKNKQKKFKLTYVNENNLYIAIGYGEHDRGNLAVVVRDLYETKREIYVSTTVFTDKMTISDGQVRGSYSRYPYIVLKLERKNVPVVFDIE